MKNVMILSLAIGLLVPAITFADVKCFSVKFDLKVNTLPTVSELTKEEQDFSTVYSSTTKEARYSVVIEKSTNNVFGSIEQTNDSSITFKGSLNSDGFFEFASMKGGTVIMPETLIGVSCRTDLK